MYISGKHGLCLPSHTSIRQFWESGCILHRYILVLSAMKFPTEGYKIMLKTSTSWKSIWIYLKSQIKFWNLKIQSKLEILLSCLKIHFRHGPCGVVSCAFFQVYHVVRLNMCTLHHSTGSMFEIDFQTGQTFFRFELSFIISKLYLRFQLNFNGFSKDRSFGH